jgi:hypothetical protein
LRYLIFGGKRGAAAGGAYDLIDAHDDACEAEGLAREHLGQFTLREDENGRPVAEDIEWVHVFDSENGQLSFEMYTARGWGTLVTEVLDFDNRSSVLYGK